MHNPIIIFTIPVFFIEEIGLKFSNLISYFCERYDK